MMMIVIIRLKTLQKQSFSASGAAENETHGGMREKTEKAEVLTRSQSHKFVFYVRKTRTRDLSFGHEHVCSLSPPSLCLSRIHVL